jgi:hypothetical protein
MCASSRPPAKADRGKPVNMLVQRGDMVQFVLVRAAR